MKPVVYASRIKDIHTDSERFLDEIGFDSLFGYGDNVVLKPNFVAPRENSSGATTNLDLIRVIALRLKKLGARPILTELPGMEFRTEEVFAFLGLEKLFEEGVLEIVTPGEKEYVCKRIPGAKLLKRAYVNPVLMDAKLINLPVLKTHVITGVTTGMKNLMGLINNRTRKQMHIRGIHACIADLVRLIQPELTICDAINSMEGDGAVYGTVVRTNMLFASTNQKALDKVLCDSMGIDWRSIDYIRMAEPPEDIEVKGDIRPRKFLLPQQGVVYRMFYRGLYVVDLLWEKIFRVHFNEFLYKSGKFGTHPYINPFPACAECRKCLEGCPVSAIREDWRIDAKKCLRCLRCFDGCPNNRIHVKGFSNPENYADEK